MGPRVGVLMNIHAKVRSVQIWIEENMRAVKLIAAVGLLAVIWVWFFSGARDSHTMTVFHRYRSDWNAVIFNLDQDYQIRTIEVCAVNDDDSNGEVLWKLKKGIPEGKDPEKEKLEPHDTFVYGRRIQGMKRATEAKPPKLELGFKYRLTIIAKGGRSEYDFILDEPRSKSRG